MDFALGDVATADDEDVAPLHLDEDRVVGHEFIVGDMRWRDEGWE